MRHKILLIYAWFIRTTLFFFPDIPIIMRFRGWLYSFGMKECGKDFQVTSDSMLKGLENIKVGNNCFIGNKTIIFGSGEVIIKDEVMFAPNSVIISGNHTQINGSYRYGKPNSGKIEIGKGSWVGSNTTVVMNSYLPSGSILGANSFLNKKFKEQGALYAGVPAKFIKVLK